MATLFKDISFQSTDMYDSSVSFSSFKMNKINSYTVHGNTPYTAHTSYMYMCMYFVNTKS